MTSAIRLVRSVGSAKAVPWVLCILLAVAFEGVRGYVVADAGYLVYFALAVVLPGTLLTQLLAPRRWNLVELFGLGAAVGLAWELLGWALFTTAGLQHLLVLWPLATVVLVFAAPGTRRRILAGEHDPLPARWHWAVAGIAALVVGRFYFDQVTETVPIGAKGYFPDLLFHLSLVHEAMRTVLLQTPQAAGITMHYHWFVDAHLAAASDTYGASPAVLVFRSGPAPLLLAATVLIATVARQVSRVWWSGPLAAGLCLFGADALSMFRFGGVRESPMSYYSLTLTFGTVLALGLTACLVGVSFQGWPRTAWVLVVLTVLGSMGAKPTTLPLVIAGTVASVVATLVVRRSVWLPGVGMIAFTAAAFLFASRTVTGSSAGTPIRLLGILRLRAGYSMTHDHVGPGSGTWIVGGLVHPSELALAWVLALLSTWVLAQALLFLGLGTVFTRAGRRDPIVWWFAGAIIAGIGLFLVVDHPGFSEIYFLGAISPYVAIVSTHLLTSTALPGRRRDRWILATIAGVTGAVLALGIHAYGRHLHATFRNHRALVSSLAHQSLATVAAAGLVGLLWFVLRRRAGFRGFGLAFAILAVCGGVIGTAHWRWLLSGPDPLRKPEMQFSAPELAGAEWISHHTAQDAVVVTPTRCRIPVDRLGCDARNYLISGIGGRRTLLEGWGYSQQSIVHQRPGILYTYLPCPWPRRLALTNQTMSDPTEQTVRDLAFYKVTWAFTNGSTSPTAVASLDRLARMRFHDGDVRIYEFIKGPQDARG